MKVRYLLPLVHIHGLGRAIDALRYRSCNRRHALVKLYTQLTVLSTIRCVRIVIQDI